MTEPFTYCLNTSTIRGQALSLPEEIRVIAQAGYDSIEPWVREIDAFTASGGNLVDLRMMIADAGLTVPNLIGFFTWAVDDDALRKAGLDEARRTMELCAALDCPTIAAPPFGATEDCIAIPALVERYSALLEVGAKVGVVPMIEFWGISQTLGRFSEAVSVAMQVGCDQGCVLADVFHMAKGGSPFEGLYLAGPHTIKLLHLNDYPAGQMENLTDSDRVYPGDGVAPLDQILSSLFDIGFRGALSVELFNESYWKQDALHVAQMALSKTQHVVRHALSTTM